MDPGRWEEDVTLNRNEPRLHTLGDSAVIVEFAARDITEAYPLVQAAYRHFDSLRGSKGIVSVVPGYTSVTVYYDPLTLNHLQMQEDLRSELAQVTLRQAEAARTVEIPVCYGGQYGPDLAEVAGYTSLTEEEVISLHSSQDYTVHMIGFAPGFPYLGGMDERIAMPRRATPRVNIPGGSVGIAGVQTGVYPNDSPGGWQLIGRTPIRLFDPMSESPSFLQAGDKVRFRPIDQSEYLNLAAVVDHDRSRTGNRREETSSDPVMEVIKPGLLTTVQDQGRYGYEHLGVSPSGAMDPMSAAVANMIVGNHPDAAVLEMTWIGPILKFWKEAWIALCGADLEALVDGVHLPNNRLMKVAQDAVLSFGQAKRGARTFLAVAGGIDVPCVLGSRSTHVHGKIGGHEGRPLRSGDLLQAGSPAEGANAHAEFRMESMLQRSAHSWVSKWQVRWESHRAEDISMQGTRGALNNDGLAGDEQVVTIRVVKGPEADWFSHEDLARFTDSPYQLSQDSNRMGYRLAGPEISSTHSGHLWSSAVSFGTIQVPPNGQPVILMAERQTTGGYPRIGVVATVDRPRLAQLRPGHQVQFCFVDVETAQELLRRQHEVLNRVLNSIRLMGGRL